jgi:hypothetical protein
MKCPQCNAPADVLETRGKPNNETYRRYRCFNEHNFSTKEVVAELSKPEEIRRLLRNTPGGLTPQQICNVVDLSIGDVRKKLRYMADAYVVEWINPPRHTAVWSVADSIRDKPAHARRPRKAAETLRQLGYK